MQGTCFSAALVPGSLPSPATPRESLAPTHLPARLVVSLLLTRRPYEALRYWLEFPLFRVPIASTLRLLCGSVTTTQTTKSAKTDCSKRRRRRERRRLQLRAKGAANPFLPSERKRCDSAVHSAMHTSSSTHAMQLTLPIHQRNRYLCDQF